MQKGFTLIELLVVIAIISVLSTVVLFSVTQYINKAKDSNSAGNLAVLIPAGEVFYNGNGNSYDGFCASDPAKRSFYQMPDNPDGLCGNMDKKICCNVSSNKDAWAACARKFANPDYAFCVDSRGAKGQVIISKCNADITTCDFNP